MSTITDRRTAIAQGGLLAADAAMASARPAGPTDARGGPLRDALIGAWQLVSCVETDVATGEVFLPMGEHPQGFILYTPDGYMSAQLSASDRRDFASGDMYRVWPTTMSRPASAISPIPAPIMSTRHGAPSSTRWR